MSWLLRLYPAGWRRRYEAEFVRLLQERPIDLRGSADTVLGAVDAHLHPELFGAEPQPWTHRVPGLLAASAGLIWSWFFIRIVLAAPGEEWGDSIGIAVMLMVVAVPGDYAAGHGRRIGLVLGASAAAIVPGRILPWSVADGILNLVAGATGWLLVAAGMGTLVAMRAGIGSRIRWLLLVLTVVIPATIAIPILGGFGPGDRGGVMAMLVALLPYGIAWMLIGLRMTLRGSATIRDTSPGPRATEVPAT